MTSIFWDHKGIIFIEYLVQAGKRMRLLTNRVCLLHDNSRPHMANATKQLLRSFGWDVYNHPRTPLTKYHPFTQCITAVVPTSVFDASV